MSERLVKLLLVGFAVVALGACSTTGESLSGAGVGVVAGGSVAGPVGAVVGGVAGAVEGPMVANEMGVPHRHWRHWRRHHHHHSQPQT